MERNEISQLADLMIEKGLTVLDMTAKGETIRLERATTVATSVAVAAPTAIITEAPTRAKALPAAQKLHDIKSPTVGTFYVASEPGKEPFVKVGDKVNSGDILCILEAMKMQNDIVADVSGVIAEVCADNSQIVEYGQVLFRIDTSV